MQVARQCSASLRGAFLLLAFTTPGLGQGGTIEGVLSYGGPNQQASSQRVLLVKVGKNVNGDTSLTQSVKFSVITDPQGRFNFTAVPQGTYGLISGLTEVQAVDGRGPLRIAIKDNSDRISLGRIALSRGAEIEGVLVREGSGDPATKTQLMVCPIAEMPDGETRFRMNLSLTAETDEQGRFRIVGIPPGSYGLMALLSFATEMTGSPQMGYARGKEPFRRMDNNAPIRINIKQVSERLNLGTIITK